MNQVPSSASENSESSQKDLFLRALQEEDSRMIIEMLPVLSREILEDPEVVDAVPHYVSYLAQLLTHGALIAAYREGVIDHLRSLCTWFKIRMPEIYN